MNLLLADLHKFVGYSGGIEHVLSRMAFAMKEKGYHVSVVMADEKEGASFYPFPEDCHFYNLFHMAGMKPIRMSSLGKGLREITAFSARPAPGSGITECFPLHHPSWRGCWRWRSRM